MTAYEIFRKFLPHKEVLCRQLKINNEVVTDLQKDYPVADSIELGEWLCQNPPPDIVRIFDIRDFFGEGETNVECLSYLSNYILVSLSKKPRYGSEYVFKICDK